MISAFISLEIAEVPLDKEKERERRGTMKQDELLRAGSEIAVMRCTYPIFSLRVFEVSGKMKELKVI